MVSKILDAIAIGSMELFKDTNIDFLGKKWPFIILSALLLLGWASVASL